MEIYDIVKKLIGEINPVGETNTDDKRFENLKATINLIDELLLDIDKVAENKDRCEFSIKRAGEYTYKYLEQLTK